MKTVARQFRQRRVTASEIQWHKEQSRALTLPPFERYLANMRLWERDSAMRGYWQACAIGLASK